MKRKKEGIFVDPRTGRAMEYRDNRLRIFWSPAMLDYLRRNFPTTINEELAECLGCSIKTMVRKAKELGLEKDRQWLLKICAESRAMARSASRRKGWPGGFKKGVRANPECEFKKGMHQPPEVKRKIAETLTAWHRRHPFDAHKRALKAWQTKKNKLSTQSQQTA